MKFKFVFDADLRETMEKVFRNEQINHARRSKGMIFKMLTKEWKKQMGYVLQPKLNFEFISNTEAIVDIDTGINHMLRDDIFLNEFKKKYERDSRGKVKIELVKEDTEESEVG